MADGKYKEFLSKIFIGGLQPYIPRDEGAIYMRNLMNDCVMYCLKDIPGETKNISVDEKECARNFFVKNFTLLNEKLN